MTGSAPVALKTIDVFLSFAALDQVPANDLWTRLRAALATSGSYRWQLWQFDKNLLAGDDFDAEIQDALAQAELGIFAISPAFLTSSYIQHDELRPFLASEAVKRIVPIQLKAAPQDADLRGLQTRQIFGFHVPYACGRPPHYREAWANRLADELHRVARRHGLGH